MQGRYRSNFRNIPQTGTLDDPNNLGKMGVFELDGYKLVVAWVKNDDGYTTLGMVDANGNIFFPAAKSEKAAYFSFEKHTGMGVSKEIKVNGKTYTIAIAGRNSDKDGFRMWVEDSLPTDKAECATDSYGIKNYDMLDILEGVYKPGFKHIWGEYAPEYQDLFDNKDAKVYKYNYNGVDFVVGWNNSAKNLVLNSENKPFEPASKSEFRLMYGNKGKRTMTQGYGYEGKMQFGDKKVTVAVTWAEGKSYVFIKE